MARGLYLNQPLPAPYIRPYIHRLPVFQRHDFLYALSTCPDPSHLRGSAWAVPSPRNVPAPNLHIHSFFLCLNLQVKCHILREVFSNISFENSFRVPTSLALWFCQYVLHSSYHYLWLIYCVAYLFPDCSPSNALSSMTQDFSVLVMATPPLYEIVPRTECILDT